MLGIAVFGLAEMLWVIEESILGIDPTNDLFLSSFYVIPNLFFLGAVITFFITSIKNYHPIQLILDLIVMAVMTMGTIYIFFFSFEIFGQVHLNAESITAFLY
jgi:hypothetical protein